MKTTNTTVTPQNPTASLQPIVLTVRQVADLLQISPSAIYEKTRFRAGQQHPLPYRRVGKFLRFIRSEVEAWLLNLPISTKQKKRQYRLKVA